MRDDDKLMVVHTTLISVGVFVHIAGLCVAVCLGVILFKKASKRIGMCITYSTAHEMYMHSNHNDSMSPALQLYTLVGC